MAISAVTAKERRRTMADGTEELVMTNNVAPVVHGHWDKAVDPLPLLKCSICGCEVYRRMIYDCWYGNMKFCPNCGAEMDED